LRRTCCRADLIALGQQARPAGYYHAVLDLETATDRWWSGDVKGAGEDLKRVTVRALAESPSDDLYLDRIAGANLVMGRISLARQLCSRMTSQSNRSECFLKLAYASGDSQTARTKLAQLRTSGPTESVFAPAILVDEGMALWLGAKIWFNLERNANGKDLWNGLALLADGHPKQAADELQKRLRSEQGYSSGNPWRLLWLRLAAAAALERQGKIKDAITQLTVDTRPGVVDFHEGWPWPRCRIKLAELYRKAGRPDDATKVEEELRYYLSEADEDHPLRRGLFTANASARAGIQ
jgi:tetratricopeptide repeat protein